MTARKLSSKDVRALLFGHALSLGGAIALAMASCAIFLFIATYEISFSALRTLDRPTADFQGRVDTVEPLTLLTGESIPMVTALYNDGDALRRVRGFSATPNELKVGEEVLVLVPKADHRYGWIKGLWRFPVVIADLARMSGLLLLPGLILSLLGLLSGYRNLWLARHGAAAIGRRTTKIPLPRPLADRYIDRFRFQDAAGRDRSCWSYGPAALDEEELLASDRRWRGSAVASRLLPHRDNPQRQVGVGLRRTATFVLLLAAAQAAVLLLFLFT